MSEFLSPGVFIEEVDAGPKPIEGVSTSTAGAVGVTRFGPTSGKPVLVTSFAEFVRIFGPPIPEPTDPLLASLGREKEGGRWWQFALSIKGFFDNGGQRIFVKRVFSKKGSQAAHADFKQGIFIEIDADAGAGDNVLKLRHLIGVARLHDLTVFNPAPIGDFDVMTYDPATSTVRLDRPLGQPVRAGKSFVRLLFKPPAADEITFTVQAKALGEWGNDLKAQVQPMVGATSSLLADPATSTTALSTKVAAAALTWVLRVDDMTDLTDQETVTLKRKTYKIHHVDAADTHTIQIDVTPPVDLLTLEEAKGAQPLRIERSSGYRVAKVAKELPTPGGDTLELNEVAKLAVGDLIKVGTDSTSREIRSIDPSAKKVTVDPRFTGVVSQDADVKKVSANVLGGGTRTRNTLNALGGIKKDDFIVFVPTGKRFKVVEKLNPLTIKIVPAIPLGFDWLGQTIQKIGAKAATIKTAPAAGDKSLQVKIVTSLRQGDAVWIGSTRYVLTSDLRPDPAAAEGSIEVDPPVPATDIPLVDAEVLKLEDERMVTDTTAEWKLKVDDATGFAPHEHVLINGEELELDAVDVQGKSFSFASPRDAGDPWKKGLTVRRLLPATNASAQIHVSGATKLYKGAIVELDNGRAKDVAVISGLDGDKVTLKPPPQNSYFEGHKLRVIEAEIQARQVVDNKVVQQESFTNLRLADDKTTSYFVTAVKNGSSLIEIADPLGPGFPNTEQKRANLANFPASGGGLAPLEKGEDGLEQLTVDDFVGEDGGSGKRTGIQALEDIDEVSICLAPDVWAPTVHQALILHCETLKDRFAILDPQDGLDIGQIRDVKETLDSKYAALYYPWIEVRDSFVGQNVQVAPSGHMAGIYARVDVERGVHKAPANEIIRGITKIADEVTKREQDLLNPKGINALRFFPGRGNRVWGARTISSDSSWKYVNVRRLFIFVEESIDEGTQFVVFEPNAEPTWARVRQTITNFLTTVWRSGALEGTTADQAFFVRCDRTTMSQDDIDNGRLICVIGIAPVKPAEFVVFRIQQKTLDSKTT